MDPIRQNLGNGGGSGSESDCALEVELARARATVERLRDERAVLTELLLHDVRGTLASLRLAFEVMLRNEVSEEMLSHAERATEDLLALLDSMVEANRFQSRYFEVAPEPVDLSARIRSVIERSRLPAEATDVQLIVEDRLPAEPVKVAVELVERIVANLVSNAIEATGPGSLVRVSAEPGSEGTISIRVEDDGPGIPPELEDRIHEPYYSSWAGGDRGSGLGLAICRLAARLLGATLEHRARQPRGTVFELRFPV